VVENVVAERVIRPRSGSTPEPSRQRRSAQRHNSNESGGSAGALRGTADALVEPPSELPSAELVPNLSALPQPRMSEDSPDDVLAGLQRTRRSNRNRRGWTQHQGVGLGLCWHARSWSTRRLLGRPSLRGGSRGVPLGWSQLSMFLSGLLECQRCF